MLFAEPQFQDKMRQQILERLCKTYKRVGQNVLASCLHTDGSKLDSLVRSSAIPTTDGLTLQSTTQCHHSDCVMNVRNLCKYFHASLVAGKVIHRLLEVLSGTLQSFQPGY